MFLFQLVFRTVSQLEHTTIMNKKWFVGAIVLFRIKIGLFVLFNGYSVWLHKKIVSNNIRAVLPNMNAVS